MMEDIEVTERDGTKTKYTGSYDPETGTISKVGGGRVHLRGREKVETTPSLLLVGGGLILIGLIFDWLSKHPGVVLFIVVAVIALAVAYIHARRSE